MIKYFFVLLFIAGCQQNWSINEKNNFIDRCENQKIWNEGFNLSQKNNFCECILNEDTSMKPSIQKL